MGGILLIIFLILIILFTIGMIIWRIVKGDEVNEDYSYPYPTIFAWIGGFFIILFLVIIWFNTWTIIDAGEVGIEVEFGKIKEKTLSEGWNSKSLYSEIITYSIRLNEYTMSVAEGEGEKVSSDGVDIRTLDDSKMTVDATVIWTVDSEKAFDIYKRVSKNMNNLKALVIRPNIRSIMRDIGAKYTQDAIMEKRAEYGNKVHNKLKEYVQGTGIIIDKVLIRDISPPENVDLAIQNKLKAEQELQQKTFELEKAKKDADIKRVEAQGIADAQEIIQKKLTPLYVQYYAVENYKKLAESPNTTFIIAPTSPNGTGMPIIIDGK